MDEIELKVHDMSSTLQPADAYALVLEEVNGNRKLPIIIGSLEAQAIKVVMMGYKMPRPLTLSLLQFQRAERKGRVKRRSSRPLEKSDSHLIA